jgi:molybdopterin converting factor small subunit
MLIKKVGRNFMLSIKIKYFGMIGEKTKKDNEIINIKESVTIKELKSVILHKHPGLKKLDFQIARNLSIAAEDEKVIDNDELALLPPFAGG